MSERTLLVFPESGHEPMKVTIPQKARITFAKINPQSQRGGGFDGQALRIYEGTSQIACFTNIKSFQDTTKVKVERRVQRVEEEREHESDGQGNAKDKRRRRVEHEWVSDD